MSTGITHLITYRRHYDNGTITLEWTCPKGWSTSAVRDAFQTQFPSAEIISITEVPW
jgi:hypothetical protein